MHEAELSYQTATNHFSHESYRYDISKTATPKHEHQSERTKNQIKGGTQFI